MNEKGKELAERLENVEYMNSRKSVVKNMVRDFLFKKIMKMALVY